MTCWHCGKETQSETECDDCCFVAAQELLAEMAGSPQSPRFDYIDWSKVRSFEELKQILHAFGFKIARGSPIHKKLKHWLTDGN